MDSYGTESKDDIKLVDEELGVLGVSKRESVSPKFVNQRRKESISHFAWDQKYTPDVIEVTNCRGLFLKEEAYLFRSVIADRSFSEGIHYWEIVADARTENELKIGVCKNRDFDLKTAFCDYSFGWAFYGNGQLRHCDGANGQAYCKQQFKKEGVLGVLLDMSKGTLSLSLNESYLGIAFEDDELKQGPIWPAVALLHVAGCSLVTGKAPPACFFT